ncbi:hypothetical protein ZWY2020_017416 [Hordeum vulgare]|nr:hypothetical protein ZWY2020_017416 [Hordeum vulgare]
MAVSVTNPCNRLMQEGSEEIRQYLGEISCISSKDETNSRSSEDEGEKGIEISLKKRWLGRSRGRCARGSVYHSVHGCPRAPMDFPPLDHISISETPEVEEIFGGMTVQKYLRKHLMFESFERSSREGGLAMSIALQYKSNLLCLRLSQVDEPATLIMVATGGFRFVKLRDKAGFQKAKAADKDAMPSSWPPHGLVDLAEQMYC